MEETKLPKETKLPIEATSLPIVSQINDKKDQQFDKKTRVKMEFIYKSLEDGWIVKKLEHNKYEFIKGTTNGNGVNNEYESPRRSVSSPIVKNIKFKFKN